MLLSILAAAAVFVSEQFHFVVLDPGHFHAALALKRDNTEVAKDVYVFAPPGDDVEAHVALVRGFNARKDGPTSWNEIVCRDADYLTRFREWAADGTVDPRQCVVLLAGRNDRKGDYALAAVKAGFNVLSDKPMAVTSEGFARLREAAELAEKKGLVFADMMTGRHEILSLLQGALAADHDLYGEQEKGTPEEPAIVESSVHHFCKLVDGKPLRRSAWYYDTRQQGEGIVDVTTHLVDGVQRRAFPGRTLTSSDVKVFSARSWPTVVSAADFAESTGLSSWPPFLRDDVGADGSLRCLANGEFVYSLRGVNVRMRVTWNVRSEPGRGDVYESLMRGTKAEIAIRPDAVRGRAPGLFVRSRTDPEAFERTLRAALARLEGTWKGLSPVATGAKGEWRIVVPEGLFIAHEEQFARVVAECLAWMKLGSMPVERRRNMLVKYWTLTEAWRMAHGLPVKEK